MATTYIKSTKRIRCILSSLSKKWIEINRLKTALVRFFFWKVEIFYLALKRWLLGILARYTWFQTSVLEMEVIISLSQIYGQIGAILYEISEDIS